MSDQNKAVVRKFYEAINNQKFEKLEDVVASNFTDHNPMPGQAAGLKGLRDMFTMWLGAFPDSKFEVEEMVAEKDIVVTRFSVPATHKGTIMGAAPTNKKVTFHGMDMVRVKEGKVTDVWHYGDELTVLGQLGVRIPT